MGVSSKKKFFGEDLIKKYICFVDCEPGLSTREKNRVQRRKDNERE